MPFSLSGIMDFTFFYYSQGFQSKISTFLGSKSCEKQKKAKFTFTLQNFLSMDAFYTLKLKLRASLKDDRGDIILENWSLRIPKSQKQGERNSRKRLLIILNQNGLVILHESQKRNPYVKFVEKGQRSLVSHFRK